MVFVGPPSDTERLVLLVLWHVLFISSSIITVWYWRLRDRDIIHARLPMIDLLIMALVWILLYASFISALWCKQFLTLSPTFLLIRCDI